MDIYSGSDYENIKDLISRLVVANPSQRLTLPEIMGH